MSCVFSNPLRQLWYSLTPGLGAAQKGKQNQKEKAVAQTAKLVRAEARRK